MNRKKNTRIYDNYAILCMGVCVRAILVCISFSQWKRKYIEKKTSNDMFVLK